jgi:hypothetical protein
MSEAIATPFFDFARSKPIDRTLRDIGLFSFENATSNARYNLPSYLTYLIIKHYEIPTATYYDLETIELDNVDFAIGDEEILESDELIITQKEHDAYFLEPINIRTRIKTKVIFK